MDLKKIDQSKLTIEQRAVLHLANYGFITNVSDVRRSMEDPEYANLLILGTGIPDIPSDPEGDGDCDHEALTNEEIQEVFDNDYYE